MKLKLIISVIMTISLFFNSFSCTTFVLKSSDGDIVFGRNFDFPVGDGHIQINYRNTQKTSFIRPPEIPLTWISKYGSITFNQAGREFPYGGINEKGLVIEQMWLQEADYPDIDNRYGLNELQWIQYQLDNSATVEEVIDSDSLVRISEMATSFIHFLVCDAAGNTATIEYINGEMVIHSNKNLPYEVLSNCTYQHSLDYKMSLESNDQTIYNEWTQNSSGRFIKAAELIENFSEADNMIDYSFSILDSVSQSGSTQWSIVYDISHLNIYYKTSSNQNRQSLEISSVDFSCKPINLFVPIAENISDIDSFRELTFSDNLGIMKSVVNNVEFLRNSVPAEYLEASARYVETVHCIE